MFILSSVILCRRVQFLSCKHEKSMSFMYFAYGSNLFKERLHKNCPSAQRKGIGKLKNYSLTFNGYSDSWKGAAANIVENQSSIVWGAIWEIAESEEPELNKQESGYNQLKVMVEKPDGSELLCKVYQMINPDVTYSKPSTVYKNIIIQGAKESELPSDYIKLLENIEDNGYNGKVVIK